MRKTLKRLRIFYLMLRGGTSIRTAWGSSLIAASFQKPTKEEARKVLEKVGLAVLTQEQAYRVLEMMKAMVKEDYSEAYHQLYELASIGSPNPFEDPFERIKTIAGDYVPASK